MHTFLPPDVADWARSNAALIRQPPRANAWRLALVPDEPAVAIALLRRERAHLADDAAALDGETLLWWCSALRRGDMALYAVVLAERQRREPFRAWVPTTKLAGDSDAPWSPGARVMVMAGQANRTAILAPGMEGRIVGGAIRPGSGLVAVAELASYLAKSEVGTAKAYLVEFPAQS